MKSRTLVLFSGTLTLGFGYWLAEASRDAREIWVAMGAWVLGFWFASHLLGAAPVQDDPPVDDAGQATDEEEEAYDEEGYEYEDDEYEYEDEEEAAR